MSSRVLLSLDNVLLPKEMLLKTPSLVDGMDAETETSLRILGCELMQIAGIMLKVRQEVVTAAQILYQRFYYSASFVLYQVDIVAMVCIFLAAKVEEQPRRIRDVINVFHYIDQRRTDREIIPLDTMSVAYRNRKNELIKAERRVLNMLGFCVHVKHPHKLIINFLRVLDLQEHDVLAQRSWSYMNDALRTNVFVRFCPPAIASATIMLACRDLEIPLPTSPPWWELFNTTLVDMEEIARCILWLYTRVPDSLSVLRERCIKLKAIRDAAKAKHVGNGNTPASSSHLGHHFGTPAPGPNAAVSPLTLSSDVSHDMSIEKSISNPIKSSDIENNTEKYDDRYRSTHERDRSRDKRESRRHNRNYNDSRSSRDSHRRTYSRSPHRHRHRHRSRSPRRHDRR